MTATAETVNFNRPDKVIEGWYWLMRSNEVKRGQVKHAQLLGRDLAVYRGKSGKAVVLDAYCPHMGAHLAEGKVEGDELRCFFHQWKYDASGKCNDIPCHRGMPIPNVGTQSWPVGEKYGLIWVWTGEKPRHPIPFVPELGVDGEYDFMFGNRFTEVPHPNVVMINAIDIQHFRSVHLMPNVFDLQTKSENENCVTFENVARLPDDHWMYRLMGRFYKGAFTNSFTYWNGSTGIVTTGPDFLHFYLVFCLRRAPDGSTQGQTIFVQKKRRGVFGWIRSRAALWIAKILSTYLAKGDTKVFNTIRFKFKTPVRSDRAVIDFIRHLDAQPTTDSWETNGERTTPALRKQNTKRLSVIRRQSSGATEPTTETLAS